MSSAAESSPFPDKSQLGVGLVVEDSVMIALEVEALLKDAGAEDCLWAATSEAALLLIELKKIDFAILDVNLGQEQSVDVALALHARKLPFIFLTGYTQDVPLTIRFPDVPVLTKPLVEPMLHEALKKIRAM